MARRALTILLPAGLLLAAAGCGGGTKTVTVTKPATNPATQTQAQKPATPATTAPGGAVKQLAFFQTPSKNIACGIGTGAGARCDIAQKSWTAPPKPSTCQFDWGNGAEVQDQKGTLACASDTLLGQGETLDYGDSSQKGDFRCLAQESGVTCANLRTGHGFVISRDAFRLF